jgi:GntR family transcriptional regulator, transcriptional repressor for pyruvate dehydrogenase complex
MSQESVRQLHKSGPGATDDASWSNPALTRFGDLLSYRMAEMIERGEFGVGSRLPAETELAERFGVSRPVVREALSRLRSAGVIISKKGSGSYVSKRADDPSWSNGFGPVSSLAQVKKCYEFRMGLEGEAAYYAAENRTQEMLMTMRDALDRMESAVAQGIIGMSADFEFHLAIARASGNEFFENVMRAMRTPIEFAINLARSLALTRTREHLLTVQAEHVVMFEAIEARDKGAARLAMRTHIENARLRVFEGPKGPKGAYRDLVQRVDSADDGYAQSS